MLHIAVVDDEQEQRSLLEELLHRFERENGQSFGIPSSGMRESFCARTPAFLTLCCWTSRCLGSTACRWPVSCGRKTGTWC